MLSTIYILLKYRNKSKSETKLLFIKHEHANIFQILLELFTFLVKYDQILKCIALRSKL